MNKEGEESIGKTIRFTLAVSETGGRARSNLEGTLNYRFSDGLILITDHPLRQGNVLHLKEEINGCRTCVVRRVAMCGKAYMVHIEFDKDRA